MTHSPTWQLFVFFLPLALSCHFVLDDVRRRLLGLLREEERRQAEGGAGGVAQGQGGAGGRAAKSLEALGTRGGDRWLF